ncbi:MULTISPECIES: carboxymuconolactone decarboxylase family protein [Edaphocola]|jgi:AhpD family alkylhydroperoxidase|uniref:carboxymuconolactone decarboxylase family protein n=1 Tax=Edaphocola TaxID=2601681 RepID=UPI00100C219E|nr:MULTISPECIES: carboxymuconolactone decarboxylase family protein [Edaphocola]
MNKRVNVAALQPAAYKAMFALEQALASGSISPIHKELIKIRASQINGCAFCLDMHTKDALKYGETPQRIFLLNAWKETDLFSEEEKVILAITEEITLISHHGLTEETYAKASSMFDEQYISQLIMAVVTINAWNRIAISTLAQVPKD